jgi:hypothetical protein
MHAHAVRPRRLPASSRLRHPAPHRPRLSTQRERDEASEIVERLVNAGVPYAAAAATARMRFGRGPSPWQG